MIVILCLISLGIVLFYELIEIFKSPTDCERLHYVRAIGYIIMMLFVLALKYDLDLKIFKLLTT